MCFRDSNTGNIIPKITCWMGVWYRNTMTFSHALMTEVIIAQLNVMWVLSLRGGGRCKLSQRRAVLTYIIGTQTGKASFHNKTIMQFWNINWPHVKHPALLKGNNKSRCRDLIAEMLSQLPEFKGRGLQGSDCYFVFTILKTKKRVLHWYS